MSDTNPPTSPIALPPDLPNIYYPGNRAVIYVMAGLFAILGLIVLFNPQVAGLGLLPLAVAGYMVWVAAMKRLSLSARGLEYREFTGTTVASWAEVTGIVMWTTSYTSRGAPIDRVPALALANSGKKIPLPYFGGLDWNNGPLGQDLRTWAPRLLQDFETQQP